MKVPNRGFPLRLSIAVGRTIVDRIRDAAEGFADWVRIKEITRQIEHLESERRYYGASVPLPINIEIGPQLEELNREVSVLHSRKILKKALRLSIRLEPSASAWDSQYWGFRLTQDEFRRLRMLIRIEKRERLKTVVLVFAPLIAFLGTMLAVYVGYRLRR